MRHEHGGRLETERPRLGGAGLDVGANAQ